MGQPEEAVATRTNQCRKRTAKSMHGIAQFITSLLFLYILIQTLISHELSEDSCLGVCIRGIACSVGGTFCRLVYRTHNISGNTNPAVTFRAFPGMGIVDQSCSAMTGSTSSAAGSHITTSAENLVGSVFELGL
uniref:Uncharacterized protein n=1 Tax=Physcomitrium patens TaxID=3218 RepID=A0A2K1ICP3_PHYPA|nr:hypothetical protein PHYPA_030533 [Physcomitrium patens]